MIQANELRIGNLIKFSDCVYTIRDLNENTQNTLDNGVNAIGISRIQEIRSYEILTNGKLYTFNNIDPVPLSEEILLKCGFSKIGNSGLVGGITYQDDNMTLLFGQGDVVYFHVDTRYMSINSLHQLQNLYFILNNKELEINE